MVRIAALVFMFAWSAWYGIGLSLSTRELEECRLVRPGATFDYCYRRSDLCWSDLTLCGGFHAAAERITREQADAIREEIRGAR